MPDDFAEECLYAPDAWYIHDLELDLDGQRVIGTCDTTRIGHLVDAQRPWPGHPKHLPGAIAIQLTGTLAQLLGVYVLGMRATEGWVGYGTHVHQARFRTMGEIGPPVRCEATLLTRRTFQQTVFTRIRYLYTQHGQEIYLSEQTAAWVRSEHRGPLPA